jgi:Recombination endonuclease VII
VSQTDELICSNCNEPFPAEQKYLSNMRCPACMNAARLAANRKWRKNNKQKALRSELRRCARRLGLDPDEIERKFDEHDGLCDICGEPPSGPMTRLAIDHDHKTGRFRGWLCGNCNRGLGYMQDDVGRLLASVKYLRRDQ